ncbi:unnamed protein product [Effrenium voratum]|nr:unnamed protein product [Effrenium voratum]
MGSKGCGYRLGVMGWPTLACPEMRFRPPLNPFDASPGKDPLTWLGRVGASGTGKTTMLGELIKEHDPAQMANFDEQRSNLMMHHQFQVGGRLLKFLDCSGNDRAAHLVKEWFARTQWVFVVYSLTDAKSYEKALTLMEDARQAGAGVVLFANKYEVNQGKPVVVNLQEAHHKATQVQAYSVEGTSLSDAVKSVATQDEQEGAEGPIGEMSEDAKGRSSISAAIDSVKSWFGGPGERGNKASGVLRPSLKGTKAMKQAKKEADPNADLRPVQELQDSESAVTCVCFGQEKLHRSCSRGAHQEAFWNLMAEVATHLHLHSHAHPPGPINDGSLAYRLEDYLLSASCLMELNAFAQRHAWKFDEVGPSSPKHDHPHDWHDIFQDRFCLAMCEMKQHMSVLSSIIPQAQEYEEMMRRRTDQFLDREGVTAEQAVEECFRMKNEGNSKFQYFEYLAAAVDYRKFHALMLDFKARASGSRAWLQLQFALYSATVHGCHVATRCCGKTPTSVRGLIPEPATSCPVRHCGKTGRYILFVTASKDGTVVVYRCYRTEMEIAMLAGEDFRGDTSSPPADHSNIAVHTRLVGHSRAITSVFFNLLEDQLVTTSIDKSVRFWNVDTGEMLKVFTDSSPVPVAAFLPFNPQVFVAANSNAVLRLVNVQNGMVLQKLKVETEVRTLKFDDTGLFLLAGTKSGSIHVLEATDNNSLKFKFKVQLARGGALAGCLFAVGFECSCLDSGFVSGGAAVRDDRDGIMPAMVC